MSFKVVHAFALPDVDLGEELLEPLDAALVKGMWLTEDKIISHARDADAGVDGPQRRVACVCSQY